MTDHIPTLADDIAPKQEQHTSNPIVYCCGVPTAKCRDGNLVVITHWCIECNTTYKNKS